MLLVDLWKVVPSSEQVLIYKDGVLIYSGTINDCEWEMMCYNDIRCLVAYDDCLSISLD